MILYSPILVISTVSAITFTFLLISPSSGSVALTPSNLLKSSFRYTILSVAMIVGSWLATTVTFIVLVMVWL